MRLAVLLTGLLLTQAAEYLLPGARLATVLPPDAERTESEAILAEGGAPIPCLGIAAEIEEAGWYHVELVSHLFDAYLIVRDGAGAVLGEADGGSVATHARLELELAPGTHTIEVCAVDEGSGPFEVVLNAGRAPAIHEGAELDDTKARAQALHEHEPGAGREIVALEHLVELLLANPESTVEARAPLARLLEIHEQRGEALEAGRTARFLAELCHELGFAAQADLHAVRAVTLLEAELGGEDTETAETRALLGLIAFAAQRTEEAVGHLERAFNALVEEEGPTAGATLATLESLSTALAAAGRPGEARRRDAAQLDLVRTALGGGAPATCALLGRLGDLAHLEADLPGARAYLTELVGAPDPGREHLDRTAGALWDLGWVLREEGDERAAVARFEDALRLEEETRGAEAPETLAVVLDLARALVAIGEDAEAGVLMRRALSGLGRLYGEDHPETATVRLELAALDEREGRPDPEPLERARTDLAATYGPAHPRSLGAALERARFEARHGDIGRASSTLERLATALARTLGEDHPRVGRLHVELGVLRARAGSFDLAREGIARGGAILRAALGRHHVEVIDAVVELARVEIDSGRTEAARTLLLEDLASRPPTHWEAWNQATVRARFESLAAETKALELLLSIEREDEVDLEAYEAFARWRSGRFARRLEGREHVARRAGDARPFLAELARVRTLLARLPDAVDDASAMRNAAVLHERVRELETELSRRLGPPASRLPFEQLAWNIPGRAALVDFAALRPYRRDARRGAFVEPHLFAWITRNEPARLERVDLGPRAAIADVVARAGAALRLGADDIDVLMERAAETVWRPVAQHLGDELRILLVLDPVLVGLPFEALPTGEKLLVEERTFVHLTEVSRSSARESSASRREVEATFLIAGAVEPRDAGPRFLTPGPLAGVAGELELVTRLHDERFGSKAQRLQLAGENATLARLLAELPERAAIHLALPERVMSPNTPRLVEPTPGDTGPAPGAWPPGRTAGLAVDGAAALEAGAIALLDLRAGVVLTGTSPAPGDVQAGASSLDLARAFITAGASSVVLTRWRPAPEDLAALLVGLYRGVWAGEAPEDALRRVQLEILESARAEDGRSHPERWAGLLAIRGNR